MKVLDDIEAEMRAIGLWDAREGTLEHWLQHEYLPSVRADANPRPIGVYDRAHAEWVKWGPEDDGPKKLLGLLRHLDRVLEFHPSVTRFGFFATDAAFEGTNRFKVVVGTRLLKTFVSNATRRVAWQIELEHPKRERMLAMTFEWTMLQLETNKVFGRGKLRTLLPPDWEKMAFAQSWGWDTPGEWPRGRYRTTIAYWGETIAEDEFKIE